jgi:hypothetical protein
MKPIDKCEICDNPLTDKARETVTYQEVIIYVCPRCMHRIISYMTILRGYVELGRLKIDFPSITEQIEELKKILVKQGKRFRKTPKKKKR